MVVPKYEDYFDLKNQIIYPKTFLRILSVFFALLTILCFDQKVEAQDQRAMNGYLVLAEGDTLRGQFLLKLEDNLVQLMEKESIKTFSAKQINTLNVLDDEAGLERFYYPFPFKLISSYKMPTLFEMLLSGKHLSLLQRERIILETVPVYDFYMNRTMYATRNRIKAEVFLMWNEDKIRKFNYSRKELFNWLNDEQKPLKAYIKENKLSVNNRADLKKIVLYYNQLKSRQ